MRTMKTKDEEKSLLWKIRALTLFFILALTVSGLTAFPLETELTLLCSILEGSTGFMGELHAWFSWILEGIVVTNENYPFLMYGTDWLAFAHIMIAVAFLGVYLKPVRNIWIIYFGMIACISIIPTVLICGVVRQIPFYWQIVDCSFGVFGIIPLFMLLQLIKRLERVSGYVEQKY